jgi:hypothetical protein
MSSVTTGASGAGDGGTIAAPASDKVVNAPATGGATVAYGPEGTSAVLQLTDHMTYTWRLYSLAPRRRLLGTIEFPGQTQAGSLLAPFPPRQTSHAANLLLEFVSFVWVPIFALLGLRYLLELRRER